MAASADFCNIYASFAIVDMASMVGYSNVCKIFFPKHKNGWSKNRKGSM